MGIIQKQAVQTTVVTIVGTIIGVLTQSLMPFILSPEEIGALSILNSVSGILSVVFSLGFTQILLNVFAQYRNPENGHAGFLMFGIFISIFGILLAQIVFFLFEDFFLGDELKNKLIQSFAFLIFPIVFFRILFKNIDIYMRMLFSSVIGVFLENALLKFIIFSSLVLLWFDVLAYAQLAILYACALSAPGLIILIHSIFKTEKIKLPDKKLVEKKELKRLANFGLYGILTSASGIIIISVDQLMLNSILNTSAVGIYSVLYFAGMLVSIPSRGVKRISVPVLSEAWKNKAHTNITEIYQKSVVNLTVIGVYLFVLGWLCIAPVLTYIPKYESGLYVFFFIGLGQLFDMMSGVNMEILATSEKYRMNTYFNIVLAVLIIVLNYFFITTWGIVGSAVASSIAMFVVNFCRWYYLKQNFGLQPISKSVLIAVLTGTVLIVVLSLLKLDFHPLIQVAVYSICITIPYWLIVLKLNLAPDITQWLLKIKKRFL